MDPTRNNTAAGAAAWVLALLFAAPVLWMILTSFHSEIDAATNPPSLAADITLDAYQEFFGASSGVSPWPPLINSATASICSTVLVLVLAIPAAYALSIRPVKKWTDVMFFFLSTKMMPVVAAILPLFLFAKMAGALDNIWFLVLMYTSMNLPIAVWMMRSFLAEVPVEMLEASQIDGAGLLLTLRKIVAPVAMPGIAATALICFIFSWNELLLARVLIPSCPRRVFDSGEGRGLGPDLVRWAARYPGSPAPNTSAGGKYGSMLALGQGNRYPRVIDQRQAGHSRGLPVQLQEPP